MKKVVIFDTETGGFDPENGVLSLAWGEFEIMPSGVKEIHSEVCYHLPDRFDERVSPKAVEINGLTKDELTRRGAKGIEGLIDSVERMIQKSIKAESIMAFNLPFDTQILSGYLALPEHEQKGRSASERLSDTISRFGSCVMLRAEEHFGLRKWPKLEETYDAFFHDEYDAHDALEDIRATAKVLYALEKGLKGDINAFPDWKRSNRTRLFL